jgi:hypothetical protein
MMTEINVLAIDSPTFIKCALAEIPDDQPRLN